MSKMYKLNIDPGLTSYIIGTTSDNELHGNRFVDSKIFKMISKDSTLTNISIGKSKIYSILTISDEQKITQFANANIKSLKIVDSKFQLLIQADDARRSNVEIEACLA